MKKILFILTLSFLIFSCKNEKADEASTVKTKEIAINYQSFGDKISDEMGFTEKEILARYENLKPGDIIAGRFTSNVKDLCQKTGCWMNFNMGKEQEMVRSKGYGFIMPKDSTGQDIIVNGKANVEEMSVKNQRRSAEDARKSVDEIAAIPVPKPTLALKANGILIPEVQKQ